MNMLKWPVLAGNRLRAALPFLPLRKRYRPKILDLEISSRCNFSCLHCRRGGSRPRRPSAPLASSQWEAVLEDAARWLGYFSVNLHSGEPLLERERMLAVLSKCAGSDIPVSFTTNGWLLDSKAAASFAGYGNLTVRFSVDSLVPATHDRLRGTHGAFGRVMEAITVMRRLAPLVKISISSVVTALNCAELPAIARRAVSEGMAGVIFQPLQFKNAACRSELWPGRLPALFASLTELKAMRRAYGGVLNSPAQLDAMAAYYTDPGTQQPAGACLYSRTLRISEGGEVRLCQYMAPCGNVKATCLREIWNSAEAGSRLEAILACKKACKVYSGRFPA
ncbi:MAG: radical SAM protein [Elusimicrobia bacterium]|nr:radical SAM protein [Elusimicrobiota bacterium]